MLQLAIIHSFCTKSMGGAQSTTHEKEIKYFRHWSSFDHVLSIKTFTDKKTAVSLTVCVPGLDNKWCPASCGTYFSHNLGQRAFGCSLLHRGLS